MRRERILGPALAMLLLLTAGAMDPAQRVYRHNRAGIRALGSGDPDTALREFTEAQAGAGEDPRLLYNLGLALAAKGETEQAQQAWQRAARLAEGELRRDAWYNHGLSALSSGDAAGAAGSFGEALLVDPGDEQARRNLELALRRLQQQQQNSEDPQPDEQDSQSSQQRSKTPSRDRHEGSEQQRDRNRGPSDERNDRATQSNETGQERREESGDRRESATGRSEEQEEGSEDGRGHEGQDRRPASAGDTQERRDGADREMAARLLRMLEQGEKQALRRALRRQPDPRGAQQERDW